MAGNKAGGIKAGKTNKERYGSDFYQRIGALGGKLSKGGGFATDKVGKDGLTGAERARIVGSKGGEASRRPKADREALTKEAKVLEYTLINKREQDWADWKDKNKL